MVEIGLNKNYDAAKLQKAAKENIESLFVPSECGESSCTRVTVTANIRTITDPYDLKDSEHMIEIVNEKKIGGNLGWGPYNGLRAYIHEGMVQGIIDGKIKHLIPHEIGHTGGLEHPDQSRDPNQQMEGSYGNLMSSTGYMVDNDIDVVESADRLNLNQIEILYKNYTEGVINKNKNFYRWFGMKYFDEETGLERFKYKKLPSKAD